MNNRVETNGTKNEMHGILIFCPTCGNSLVSIEGSVVSYFRLINSIPFLTKSNNNSIYVRCGYCKTVVEIDTELGLKEQQKCGCYNTSQYHECKPFKGNRIRSLYNYNELE